MKTLRARLCAVVVIVTTITYGAWPPPTPTPNADGVPPAEKGDVDPKVAAPPNVGVPPNVCVLPKTGD